MGIWDFAGDHYGGDDDQINNSVFAGDSGAPTSLIFVVDAQDEPYDHVLQSFTNAVTRALELNPNIVIEVFINKVDGELFLSDESKYDWALLTYCNYSQKRAYAITHCTKKTKLFCFAQQ